MGKKKSALTGYCLAFFLGIVGAHLFYYRKYIRAVVYLLLSWTFIPIFLGWIDMIFVGRWTREINGDEKVHTPKKASDKSKETTNIKGEIDNKLQAYRGEMKNKTKVTKSEKENGSSEKASGAKTNKVSSFLKDSFTFYSEQEIILPKYSHLKTTSEIKESIEEAKKPSKKSYDRDGFSFEISISGSHYSFIKDSLKYAQTRGYECKEIPFESYWPTFESLDKRRLKWYFYWREQALKGNYMDVDLSYIFIFVYELLNYTFNQNAAFNVSMLERLNDNYRERQPKLIKYLDMWIADMLLELGEKDLAIQSTKEEQNRPKLYNLIQGNGDSLSSISITYWKPYIKNYRETTFFASHKNKIYKKFKQSIPLLQESYQEEGKNLLDEWFGTRNERQVRHLYRSAVMGRKYDDTHVYVNVIYEKEALSNVVTNLFRLAENVVRIETGEKRQIKVDLEMLSDDMKEKMINARFKTVQKKDDSIKGSKIPEPPKEEKSPKPKEKEDRKDLEFDWEEINQKDKELNQIKDKIEAKESDSEDSPSAEGIQPDVKEERKSKEFDTGMNPKKEEETKTFTDFFSDGEENFDELVEALNQVQKEFLTLFVEGEIRTDKAKEFAKDHGMMLGVFLSELNELAMEHIEDTLLEEEDDKVVIIEDYEEVIELARGVSIEN